MKTILNLINDIISDLESALDGMRDLLCNDEFENHLVMRLFMQRTGDMLNMFDELRDEEAKKVFK